MDAHAALLGLGLDRLLVARPARVLARRRDEELGLPAAIREPRRDLDRHALRTAAAPAPRGEGGPGLPAASRDPRRDLDRHALRTADGERADHLEDLAPEPLTHRGASVLEIRARDRRGGRSERPDRWCISGR